MKNSQHGFQAVWSFFLPFNIHQDWGPEALLGTEKIHNNGFRLCVLNENGKKFVFSMKMIRKASATLHYSIPSSPLSQLFPHFKWLPSFIASLNRANKTSLHCQGILTNSKKKHQIMSDV